MSQATVIIPNWNGIRYLEKCLKSLRMQTFDDFDVILIDNGSDDGSAEYVRRTFPEVKVKRFLRNTGFCHAVNTGIRMSNTPYVILLNNDVICDPLFAEELMSGMKRHPKAFSCQAKMLSMANPMLVDDAGDYYCALGWAFADGKGQNETMYRKEKKIFASCGGAAIYRRDLLNETGLFDEAHFAYLEDIDLGYRARRAGYENYFIPAAKVLHAGSATSGSRYNSFKTAYTSRNSIYLIYKNMRPWQIALNFPMLLAGNLIKAVFFIRKGYGREFFRGVSKGAAMCAGSGKAAKRGSMLTDLRIQLELWLNLGRRIRMTMRERQ